MCQLKRTRHLADVACGTCAMHVCVICGVCGVYASVCVLIYVFLRTGLLADYAPSC